MTKIVNPKKWKLCQIKMTANFYFDREVNLSFDFLNRVYTICYFLILDR